MRYTFCVTNEDLTPNAAIRDRSAAGDRVIDLTQPPPPDEHDGAAATDGRAGALAAFRRAAASSAGYRRWLARRGVDPGQVSALEQVPHLQKPDVFGADVDAWIQGGPVAAAELLTSSGHSGAFAVGATSHAGLRSQQAATDAALQAIGARAGRATLLLNCLSMGVSVPTTLATVATPSVHLEMAEELLGRFGRSYDLVIVLAEPVFAKELVERLSAARGPAWTAERLAVVVGGEWVAEPWRRHVSGLLGLGEPRDQGTGGVLISLGAAELGLHVLFETPELRAARSVLDGSGQSRELFARNRGYTPTLLTFDPRRVHVEERRHGDGDATLVFTPLDDRLLPLVRYDLGDLGELVPPADLNAGLAAIGAPERVAGPVVACWGRRSAGVQVGDRVVRPELVKQRLFRSAAEAAVLTGRFHLVGGDDPVLHVQLRAATVPTPRLAADLGTFLADVTGCPWHVEVHAHDSYPFHLPGDFQHKPVYQAAHR